jgi:hypothetical protein
VRKRRTRSHIIADLSANHVERHALLCGYSVERVAHDYGIDLLLYTYNDDGEIENEMVKIQLKATDTPLLRNEGQTVAFVVQRADLDYWLGERLPVMLIVYDASTDTAYWLHVQEYFREQGGFDLTMVGETITVYLNLSDVVNTDAMRQFARRKAAVLAHLWRSTNYAD